MLVSHLQTHTEITHNSLLQSWIMGCGFEASCFKSRHITAVFNPQGERCADESRAADSSLQPAADDYEAAFVSAVLFF